MSGAAVVEWLGSVSSKGRKRGAGQGNRGIAKPVHALHRQPHFERLDHSGINAFWVLELVSMKRKQKKVSPRLKCLHFCFLHFYLFLLINCFDCHF